MRFFIPLVLFLFFLAGCTAYDTLRHQTFTMQVPQWKHQEVIPGTGVYPLGYFSSNADCFLNVTISTLTHLQAAQPFFQHLHSLDQDALVSYEIFDSFVTAHYRLPDDREGEVHILHCPSGYTYFVDYQCTSSTYASDHENLIIVLGSLHC